MSQVILDATIGLGLVKLETNRLMMVTFSLKLGEDEATRWRGGRFSALVKYTEYAKCSKRRIRCENSIENESMRVGG